MVGFEKERGVGVITLNRPPANSYNREFVEALGQAIKQAAEDPEVKVVIVRSSLERFFSGGADVKAFAENPPDVNMAMVRRAHEVLNSLARIPKLFIAEIAGHALGGGLEIALACDLRFAAQGEYRLGLPEVTLGLLPGTGGTQRLPRLVGWGKALELMASGQTLTPEEAHRLGIVERLYPDRDTLAQETRRFAEALARGASLAIAHIKRAVYEGLDRPLEDGLRLERELVEELFRSEDGQEGVRAFLEKRQPTFKGK
ncbi:enoyl-CoA hydratase/isomerase family protein [Thermus scotoductus]|jgi:enoyl-CoA hydratase/carnithine racemase|uniref:Enoyl-CoA hydratase n=1 Tax=Thermus scotoductus TaxID=37636 RepID=A0A430RQP2_THESC|nr:enoyl-CoA hydratase-related protein [Thermus scotoductus]RTG99778.1 enoyl-CoA hydratase [Thermus scotoductus]RTH21467.1 enoyl-CoA hydratase [Thermus scotoductus]RTI40550.1 enoyl-CoA hydratase [Thermus scotoductus]